MSLRFPTARPRVRSSEFAVRIPNFEIVPCVLEVRMVTMVCSEFNPVCVGNRTELNVWRFA